MKPADFELHQPRTLDEAIALLDAHGATGKVLAGGQSLVPLLNFRLARPEHLIDLSKIAALRSLRRTSDGLAVGAMVTYQQAQRSPAVAEAAPLVSAALPHIGHDAIRARGTIGGSIAHGDPAAEMPAVAVALDAQVMPRDIRAIRPARRYEFVADGTTEAPWVSVRIGDAVMVGVQAELSAATGMALRGASPFAHTFVATLVDGGAKYMADEGAYDRITYEAMNSRYARGSAERLAAALVAHLNAIREQRRTTL